MKKIILAFTTVLLLAAACNQQPTIQQNTQTNQQQPSAITLPTPDKPALSFSNQGPKPYIQITWDYSIASYFNIYRSKTGQGDWTKILANYPASAHAATDMDYPKDAKILYYYITSADGKNNESQASPTVSVSLNQVTLNLKTYTNSQYGFEFEYPSTYSVKIHEKSTVRGTLFGVGLDSIAMGNVEGGYGPLAQIGIGVWDNSSQLSLVGWASDEYNKSFSNYGPDNTSNFSNQTISGHKAISYSWAGLNGGGKTVVIENGKTIIMVTSANTETDKTWQDFETILNTFKFSK